VISFLNARRRGRYSRNFVPVFGVGNSEILCPHSEGRKGKQARDIRHGWQHLTTSVLAVRSNGTRGKYSRIITTGASK